MKRFLWVLEIVVRQLSIFYLSGIPVSSLHISLHYLYSNHMKKILTSPFHKWGNWGKFLEASITCHHFITQVNTYYQQTCDVIKKFLALLNSRRKQRGADRKPMLALIIFFIFPQPAFQKLKLSFWSRTG